MLLISQHEGLVGLHYPCKMKWRSDEAKRIVQAFRVDLGPGLLSSRLALSPAHKIPGPLRLDCEHELPSSLVGFSLGWLLDSLDLLLRKHYVPGPCSAMNQPDLADDPDPSPEPLCVVCGQHHSAEENHFYTYTEDVDDDLICHICLQALLDPLDTPCGHTYCTLCLTNFLVEKDFCPVDRKPVVLQHCKKSSILVNKLLNKLLVTCPFPEHCTEVLQRCDLQHHFQTR